MASKHISGAIFVFRCLFLRHLVQNIRIQRRLEVVFVTKKIQFVFISVEKCQTKADFSFRKERLPCF